MLLSVHMPLHLAVKHDYPFREAVRSALPIADEVLLLCSPDDADGTRSACEELAREDNRVRVLLHDWWSAERRHHCLSDATNRLIEACRGAYHLALQADEVLHEEQAPTVRAIAACGKWDRVTFMRLNFWGSFDEYNFARDRWPVAVPRLARRSEYPGIRSHGDATEIGIFGDVPNTPQLDAQHLVQLWHYAYVRKPLALVERHAAMAGLFGLGPDPAIDIARETGVVNWNLYPRSEFVPVFCEHPAVMRDWIAARREAVASGALA